MNWVRLGFVSLLLLVVVPPAVADEVPVRRFMAGTPDGRLIQGGSAVLDRESGYLIGMTSSGERVDLAFEELSYLSVSRGSRAGQSAVFGGLVGGLVALAAVIDVGVDPEYELDSGKVAPLTVAFVAIGALVGGVVGNGQDSWEAVDLPTDDFGRVDPESRPGFQFTARF